MRTEAEKEQFTLGWWSAAIVTSLFWLGMFGCFMYYLGAYYPG